MLFDIAVLVCFSCRALLQEGHPPLLTPVTCTPTHQEHPPSSPTLHTMMKQKNICVRVCMQANVEEELSHLSTACTMAMARLKMQGGRLCMPQSFIQPPRNLRRCEMLVRAALDCRDNPVPSPRVCDLKSVTLSGVVFRFSSRQIESLVFEGCCS